MSTKQRYEDQVRHCEAFAEELTQLCRRYNLLLDSTTRGTRIFDVLLADANGCVTTDEVWADLKWGGYVFHEGQLHFWH